MRGAPMRVARIAEVGSWTAKPSASDASRILNDMAALKKQVISGIHLEPNGILYRVGSRDRARRPCYVPYSKEVDR